jgi:hypothetical protein
MKLTRTYKYIFALVSFAFTALVFMNTYEVLWNKDIVVAHSIQKMAAQQVIDTAVREFATKADNGGQLSDMGGIAEIEIPALKTRVRVEESRKVDGKWYQRPSTAHYIGLNKNKDGETVDYLIYAGKSWRSIPSPGRIETGMEVRVTDSHGATQLFGVAEKKLTSLDRSLIVSRSEDRQIVLIVEDAHAGTYYGYSLVLKK